MKRKVSLMLILMFIMASVSALTVNAEISNSGSASVDVMSNYVWRGIKLSNSGVVQPSVGITYGGFGANLWANYDTGINEHNETDLTLNYAYSINKLGLDTGYIFYALEGIEDTEEVYLAVSYDAVLSPSITVFYDYDEGEGFFVVASIGHSFELPQKLSFDLGASASYNADNLVMGPDVAGKEFSDFYNGDISASLTVPVTNALSMATSIAYSFPLSDDAEYAIEAMSDDAESDILYSGINVSLSF